MLVKYSFLVTTLLLSCMHVPKAHAQSVYVVHGPGRSVTFTSRKPGVGSHYKALHTNRFSRAPILKRSGGAKRAVLSRYDALIANMAQEHRLDPALVKAVVHVESSFNPNATSPKGAMGLMQLMPATAKRFSVSNAYEPYQNVRAGVTYLRWLLNRYKGNIQFALAAYNAGEGRVDQYRGIPPYRETQNYVSSVMHYRKLYQCYHATSTQC